MATEPMSVFVRDLDGNHKTYAINLDTCKTAGEWENEYLHVGFREPDTGKIIQPENISTVSVRALERSPLQPYPSEGALAWLEEQVDQTCAMGLS